jgi:hypothetical protein
MMMITLAQMQDFYTIGWEFHTNEWELYADGWELHTNEWEFYSNGWEFHADGYLRVRLDEECKILQCGLVRAFRPFPPPQQLAAPHLVSQLRPVQPKSHHHGGT